MLSRSLGLARRTANRQAIRRASLHVKFRPPARRPNRQTNRWCRPFRLAVSPGGRRGQLSRESELFVRCYVFVRCLTRPPNHLGMPLTFTSQSRIRFAPMKASCEQKKYSRWRAGNQQEKLPPRIRAERTLFWSEEVPTLMALGGFEQRTFRAPDARTVDGGEIGGRWPAATGCSAHPRAVRVTANPKPSVPK